MRRMIWITICMGVALGLLVYCAIKVGTEYDQMQQEAADAEWKEWEADE